MGRKAAHKKHAAAQTALLVVGEGADDKAFFNHMKNLYCKRGAGYTVKVEAGDGGSPGNIITNAIRSFRHKGYDRRFMILDSDLPPSPAENKKAEREGYQIILWSPQCLEGALLDVMGEPVGDHETSQQLKKRLHPMLAGPHTSPAAYADLFTRQTLDKTTNGSVVSARNVLRNQPKS
ncbi:hypothetical protein [Microbulbifer celer]|uniref:RloB domain-containing protein n=1 Tax=Microbulbifer celer TaxID=435905 RepID=A0ABW3U8P2_9GAMM|nr:hypothetical protein [Microbulbifer celer]UFN57111.1 hypothetical protein LPW13_16320 [Microbulbifer celer]